MATGVAVARLLYRRFEKETPAGIEVAVAGALIGLALWLATNWVLAISMALTRRNLLIAAALFVVAGCTAIGRPSLRLKPWTIVAAAAVMSWAGFALWRGSIVPPASHDALSYHLPKAVMIMRAEGHPRFDWPDMRLRTFPSNYELLLADVLILGSSDARTEWIATASFLLFLGIAALYARRWWGAGMHVAVTVIATASAPLLLLHSAHDKNDLLTAVFSAGALYWGSRWCARGGVAGAAIAILCGVMAVGTKVNGAAVAVGLVPFGIVALVRRPPRVRALTAAVVFAVAVFLLCGGWTYVQNGIYASRDAGPAGAHYGAWRNLIDVPYLLVRVSLGFEAILPWRNERWPWVPYNLYGSHYGPLFGCAFLALAFCIARFRREGEEDARRERAIATGAALIAFAVLLPLVQVPRSTSQATLRYGLFLLPIVAAWTIAPLMQRLPAKRLAALAILLIAVQQAVQTALFDTFAPIEHVRYCHEHPGTRRIHWMPNRAGSVVDRMAGPRDVIAVHGGAADIWVHPVYGAKLTREAVFVRTPEQIPPDAQWVIVDYMPSVFHAPEGKEVAFYERLRRDARFRLVHRNERLNQAVFKRV